MPEIMVACAVGQYYRATKNFIKLGKNRGWTFTHSFFLTMKGFHLNGAEVSDSLELVQGRVKLDEITLKQLRDEINDKSNADFLTKSIAVIQITRFSLGIIARAVASLTISPLEYFTCAQVFCALLMYIYWFDKPFNVGIPIHLATGDSTRRRISEVNNNRYLCTCGRFIISEIFYL